MKKTVDLIMVNKCGVETIVAKISLSSAQEPYDKEFFTIELYDTKLPAIYFKEEGKEKMTILHGVNGLPRKTVMGFIERVNDFSVLRELL